MTEKYFGDWQSITDIRAAFDRSNDYGTDTIQAQVFPASEDDVLFCYSEEGGYDGSCVVIFTHNGVLYCVEDSHCSCDGFKWCPEITNWGAEKMRHCYGATEARTALTEIADHHLGTPRD